MNIKQTLRSALDSMKHGELDEFQSSINNVLMQKASQGIDYQKRVVASQIFEGNMGFMAAIPADKTSHDEVSGLRVRSDGEQDFVNQHKVEKWHHPVAMESQFSGAIPKFSDHGETADKGSDTGMSVEDMLPGTAKLKIHNHDGASNRSPKRLADK